MEPSLSGKETQYASLESEKMTKIDHKLANRHCQNSPRACNHAVKIQSLKSLHSLMLAALPVVQSYEIASAQAVSEGDDLCFLCSL